MKNKKYLCQGCFYLNKFSQVINKPIIICNVCEENLILSNDPKMICLLKTFSIHNKKGYHCKDCRRFIPHPLNTANMETIISCPYFDCCFVGPLLSLDKMHYPMQDIDLSADEKLSIKDDDKVLFIKEIINSQLNSLIYSSSEFTIKHKTCCYLAINNLLNLFPSEMIDYLLNDSRKGNFQQKIFQEYVSLLEKSLPYSFRKNNKIYKIESLLDENLLLFDGISTFEAIITDKLQIKNNTEEFYIGGRSAFYTKPFYIGKLLSIIDKNTKKSLLNDVVEYGFSSIKMKNVTPGNTVIVSHLRVVPHYQMGGMSYINRVRKKIVDQAKLILNGNINE